MSKFPASDLSFQMNLMASKQLVFYTNLRILNDTVPDGFYKYEIGTVDGSPVTRKIGKEIKKGFAGSLLTFDKIGEFEQQKPFNLSLDYWFTSVGSFRNYKLSQIMYIKKVNDLCGSLFPILGNDDIVKGRTLFTIYDIIKYIRTVNDSAYITSVITSGKPIPSFGLYDNQNRLIAVFQGHECINYDKNIKCVETLVKLIEKNILFIQ